MNRPHSHPPPSFSPCLPPGISQSRISHWLLQQGSDLSEQKKRAFFRWYQLEKTNPGEITPHYQSCSSSVHHSLCCSAALSSRPSALSFLGFRIGWRQIHRFSFSCWDTDAEEKSILQCVLVSEGPPPGNFSHKRFIVSVPECFLSTGLSQTFFDFPPIFIFFLLMKRVDILFLKIYFWAFHALNG